uniref:EF-hand domain-containing protein n=1 Tax=Chromera velia CCMP2878 TaxID=1169474 RepID=A0A0G4I094_9ALVE|mmetsp:Transcript_33149/g.65829  ORF Transcript_33149/g.65829 Transcript_33149/m.65829 type:complete len:222 (-) Transcript_33149:440-1105(-)|eukprot:Cvel_9862.t1-p1 / transcript=Cvel_9862.t1 / gene=Cvel_9862 / organism=Chromera_velia_CCMP2878 / gene_product=Putative calmodulin-like protein 6, putative / transcript_product=Putative calmodulin-like protein 6, putative / location=Cvel_scaffold581:18844-20896(+) / protein_length=221 / sequence_SO=supercontig / SO=protein_coding / is_pseudo=false
MSSPPRISRGLTGFAAPSTSLDRPVETLQDYNYQQDELIKKAFALFDEDDSGAITLEELKEALHKKFGGASLRDPQARRQMEEKIEDAVLRVQENVDEDGSGEITLEEFQSMMKKQLNKNDEEDEFARAWRTFNVHRSKDLQGKCDLSALKTACGTLGETIPDEMLLEMIKCAMDPDANPAGRKNNPYITYEEFKKMCKDELKMPDMKGQPGAVGPWAGKR